MKKVNIDVNVRPSAYAGNRSCSFSSIAYPGNLCRDALLHEMKRSCGRTVVSILFMKACMATVYQQPWESVLLPLAYEAEYQSFATTIRPLVSSPYHRTDSERKPRTESCTEPETCNGRIE